MFQVLFLDERDTSILKTNKGFKPGEPNNSCGEKDNE